LTPLHPTVTSVSVAANVLFSARQNNIELYPNERTVYLPLLKKSEARAYA